MSRKQQAATFEQIVAAVKANGGVVIDDHNNTNENRQLGGVGLFSNKDGRTVAVALLEDNYFCLNEVYLDKETGKPHLSTRSVAGNVITKGVTIAEGVENYNTQQTTNKWSNGSLSAFELVA